MSEAKQSDEASSSMSSRIGRFALSQFIVDNDENAARVVMGKCVVVRCEMMYAHKTFEYVAISPQFDEVERGEIIPEYDVLISDGGRCVEFRRRL